MKDIYNPNTNKNRELHEKKLNGNLYKEKEEYKQKHDKDFYDAYNTKPYAEVFCCMCLSQNINITKNQSFVYFIDYIYILDKVTASCFGNLTPNYEILLTHGIHQLKYENAVSKFQLDYNKILDGLEILRERIMEELKKSDKNTKRDSKIRWFENMRERGVEHFDEAIQRILFVNQIMWQTNHYLTGLGGLDMILYPYYSQDIKSGYLTKLEARELLKEFLRILHQYYWYKSSMLMGDTGQIIVLGKSKEDGTYDYNLLTELFIELIQESQLPDPKLLLHVNKNIPEHILEKAMVCISTGVGSPLLSNDDVVIPALLAFGVDEKDAFNYTVSACWEPLIGGKSVSLNNMTTLNYMRALENLFKREQLGHIDTFDKFLETYYQYLERNLNAVKRVVYNAHFQYDPVLSLFITDCREKSLDVSEGGAKYTHAGITSVAMGNVIDSLLNIKKFVYDTKRYSLVDIKKMILTNYEGRQQELELLKSQKRQFGTDRKEVIDLTKKIVKATTNYTKDFRTELGGKLKFGLSAPTYIDAGINTCASFDGRESGQPFVVHISNETADSYTEIINFASELDYGENRFNGNVIDFMVSPEFITDNLTKFVTLIQVGIEKGFFQMQMNVINSKMLIEARRNPDAFPDLIVRVWGFSAYFHDLPEVYKEMLIERALKNEGKAGCHV